MILLVVSKLPDHTAYIRGGWVRRRCPVAFVTRVSNWYWLTVRQGLLSFQQIRVEVQCYFFCSFTFFHFPLSVLSLSLFSPISSISFLPFSGRRHNLSHNYCLVVKPDHNQSHCICTKNRFPHNYPWSCWTRICPAFANIVDPDRLASEASWSGSTLSLSIWICILTPLHMLFLICLYISSRALSKAFEHRNFVVRYQRETNHNYCCESCVPGNYGR